MGELPPLGSVRSRARAVDVSEPFPPTVTLVDDQEGEAVKTHAFGARNGQPTPSASSGGVAIGGRIGTPAEQLLALCGVMGLPRGSLYG